MGRGGRAPMREELVIAREPPLGGTLATTHSPFLWSPFPISVAPRLWTRLAPFAPIQHRNNAPYPASAPTPNGLRSEASAESSHVRLLVRAVLHDALVIYAAMAD